MDADHWARWRSPDLVPDQALNSSVALKLNLLIEFAIEIDLELDPRFCLVICLKRQRAAQWRTLSVLQLKLRSGLSLQSSALLANTGPPALRPAKSVENYLQIGLSCACSFLLSFCLPARRLRLKLRGDFIYS